MTITFIGHGYVGLVTALVFADFGNTVYVIGHTKEKIAKLQKGDPLIYEPGLKELLEKNLKSKRIIFTLDYQKAIPESEIVFITVGTPPKPTGEADLSSVYDVARNIARHLKKGFTVVSCKSTVPVGTNKKIERILKTHKSKNADVAVASCPEFLREGTGLYDTLNPDRVVIGSESKKAVDLLLELHRPINGKRIVSDLASAELIKYTSNAMLAAKISFANFIAFYCEKTGADAETVLDAVGLDKRIGRSFMYPGIGYGGSCLPKDVKALTSSGKNLNLDTSFLESIDEINKQARQRFVNTVTQHAKEKKITVWGLSFKPDTDDLREAPSIAIVEKLLEKGYFVTAYDPVASANAKKLLQTGVAFVQSPYEAVKNANALIVLTEWNEFKQIDLEKVKKTMKTPLVFDGRNIYKPETMKKLGFAYYSIGRPPVL